MGERRATFEVCFRQRTRQTGTGSMADLNRKSALVTGGSGGIGRAVAQRLALEQFNVIVHYSGKRAPAEQVVADIKQVGGSAVAVQADIANAADVARLFELTFA